jgi:Domain of unknown function (DUF397)
MPFVDLSTARWRKSSRSNSGGYGDGVEITPLNPVWRKSSRSNTGGNGDCVEIAVTGPAAAIRDSKNPTTTPLILPTPALAALLTTCH